MKVAMLDPSLFTGRYDDGLCAGLAKIGHDVTLYGRPMRDTDAIQPEAYAYAPRFFRMGEAVRPILGEGKAARLVKAIEYGATCVAGHLGSIARSDVVHIQWLPLAAADARMIGRLSARANRPALVHTVHNARPYHGDDARAAVQGRGYRALLDRFDALIVHGTETRDALVDQDVAPASIHIVPHPPMQLAAASPAELEAVPVAALPRILFWGTIRPYKGLDLLVSACLSLWQAGHRFELAIAGKPFMDITPLLGQIEAAGFADMLICDLDFLKEGQLDAHLRRSDILTFPYRHIDSSGAFLSALHYGKPVVASRTGMFAKIGDESDDPETGVALVPVDDSAALANSLLPLIESRAMRERRGERVKMLGRRLGDWNEAAMRTADVYAIAQKRRA